MTLVRDLTDVRPSSLLMYLMLAAACVCPGVLLVLAFRPGWVGSMEFAKLLLVSASLATPLVLLHWFALLVFDGESAKVDLTFSGVASAAATFAVIGGVAIYRLLWPCTVAQGLAGILVIEVLLIGFLAWRNRQR